jgi:oxygen-dependent protoporphyrinogen oxidase
MEFVLLCLSATKNPLPISKDLEDSNVGFPCFSEVEIMRNPDVIVIGAGISGLAFAWKAARSGRSVSILEEKERVGGCICSRRYGDGYWYELGAHTVYNSYSGLLDIVVEAGLAGRLIQRGSARTHFGLMQNGGIDWLTPPRILLQFNWLEIALHAPVGFFHSKRGRSIEQHYSGLLGPGNYRRVLSPFFAAVPSQCADTFPVEGPGSLFKKRSRRKEFPRSFGFEGGLQALCDAMAAHAQTSICYKTKVSRVLSFEGGFEVQTERNTRLRAPLVAVALPNRATASLLQESFPSLSSAVGRIRAVSVESLGARVARSKCWMPECAFIVPAHDLFFSAVTRDPFPDPDWRAFAFHFRPGLPHEQKVQRMCDVLRISSSDLDGITEQRYFLPAPQVNHGEAIADIQRQLGGTGLALLGNYFTGLAIEDCIARANSEWQRLQ